MQNRRQVISGAVYGASLFGVVVLHVVYWRMWTVRPGAGVWLAAMGLLGFSLGWVGVEALRGSMRTRRPWVPAGWFVLALSPLAVFGVYVGTTAWTMHERGNVRFGAPLRVTAFWAAGALEFEAHKRYPVRIQGEHVELIREARDLEGEAQRERDRRHVADMDRHVRVLAAQLGQPIPAGRIGWVRGGLSGFEGRAVLSLAICRANHGDAGYLDYHEVAHCVITRMAGPDHYPPTLLVEGWAQANSASPLDANHTPMILHLVWLRDLGGAVPLRDLLHDDYYARSYGPVYSHGGPFAIYLLERFGGETFFRLYREAHPDTFMRDVRRVLGVEWDTLEADFWVWLNERAEAVE